MVLALRLVGINLAGAGVLRIYGVVPDLVRLRQGRSEANHICPGTISTEIEESTERENLAEVREPVIYRAGTIPLTDGEPGRAEEVTEVVLCLASADASHISGTAVWIDGAQSLLMG